MEADDFESLKTISWALANIANAIFCTMSLVVLYQAIYIPFAAGREFSADYQWMFLTSILAGYSALSIIVLIAKDFERPKSGFFISLTLHVHVLSFFTEKIMALIFILLSLSADIISFSFLKIAQFLSGLIVALLILSFYIFFIGGVVGLLWFGVKQIF